MNPHTFGPFSRLLSLRTPPRIVSFFDDPFAEWEADASFPQRWDSAAICEHISHLAADKVALLDVGSGGGRLAIALEDSYDDYFGVDHSPAAARIFERNRAAGLLGQAETICFVLGDVVALKVRRDVPPVNVAVLGSVTINSFNTVEAVTALFDALRRIQTREGVIIVSVYEDAIRGLLAPFQYVVDVLDADKVSADGTVLWRGMHYEKSTQLLLHNLFVEDRNGTVGVLGVHTERVWSESELVALAVNAGLEVRHRSRVHVDSGGAEGWPVAVLTLAQS